MYLIVEYISWDIPQWHRWISHVEGLIRAGFYAPFPSFFSVAFLRSLTPARGHLHVGRSSMLCSFHTTYSNENVKRASMVMAREQGKDLKYSCSPVEAKTQRSSSGDLKMHFQVEGGYNCIKIWVFENFSITSWDIHEMSWWLWMSVQIWGKLHINCMVTQCNANIKGWVQKICSETSIFHVIHSVWCIRDGL